MRFVKYHGLGNDFIVLEPNAPLTPELARALCRRGFSIGADGAMRVLSARRPEADVTMDLVNSDGSLPEMCGNGIRCLVKHAIDTMGFLENPLRVDTPHGVLACRWTPGPDGKVATVRVAMGRPRFTAHDVPLDERHAQPAEDGQVRVTLDGVDLCGVAVNTGNPHFVVFGDASRATALSLGPRLELHPAFPARANIEFVEVLAPGSLESDPYLKVTVWERGCGLTHACGTGATAATAAALRLGLIAPERAVHVELPGGELVIRVAPDFSDAMMEGPVALAFSGDIEI